MNCKAVLTESTIEIDNFKYANRKNNDEAK